VRLARIIAGGAGIGFFPVASGTAASAVAVLIGAGLLWASPWVLGVGAVVASVGGFRAIAAARVEGDPGWVVIDEVAGQWIALLGLARPALTGVVAAFVLFRLLDVAKPGPVGWADRQNGAAGIMADDIIAGAIAAGVLWVVRTGWRGVFG